jgi:hypothetical protein
MKEHSTTLQQDTAANSCNYKAAHGFSIKSFYRDGLELKA